MVHTLQDEVSLSTRLADMQAAFAAGNPVSQRQFLTQAEYMPGANSRSVLFYAPFPLTMARGTGASLWDADGHHYHDFLAEYTAGVYGHSAPEIRDAVLEAMESGINLTGHNLLEGQLAAAICARFPHVQQLRFTNSGTEANLMAIVGALHFTGRPKIVVFSGAYHGGVLTFSHQPAPTTVPYDFMVLPYNDEAAVREVFATQGAKIAAVLVEPMLGAGGCIPATRAFLLTLRSLCTEAGALLVLDEVMTSRLAPHGLAVQYGITPDMTTLGKYIGGGMPFGAFGGRKDIMALFDPRHGALAHSGTFNNNVVTMAAGLAGLTSLYSPAAAGALAERGEAMRERLNAQSRASGVAMQFTGVGSVMNSHFTADPIVRPDDVSHADPRLRQLLFFHLLARGLYTAPRGLVVLSLPLADEAIAHFETAIQDFVSTHSDLLQAA